MFSKIVRETVKVAGAITKFGVETGAEVIDKVMEKTNDQEIGQNKYKEKAKELSKKITSETEKLADTSEKLAEKGAAITKDVYHNVKEDVTHMYNSSKVAKDKDTTGVIKEVTFEEVKKED